MKSEFNDLTQKIPKTKHNLQYSWFLILASCLIETCSLLFSGNPFLNYGAENEFVTVCQLICRIFESLRYNGWEVLVSTRFSRRRNTEKSAFIMKRCEPAWLAYGCIAPCEPAAIKLIDFPGNTPTITYQSYIIQQKARLLSFRGD